MDVVVPCYNYAHFLPACVASVLGQDGVEVRVLIIDDCSTDDTPAVMAELTADPRVRGRRHETNMGHIATYNEGLLGWAEADYVSLLSSDDLLAPGALSRATALMERHREVGMVYGRAVYFTDHDHLPRAVPLPTGSKVWAGADWLAGRCRTAHNVISSPEVVLRTSVQRAVGGYRPSLPHSGDLEMWLRVAAVSAVGHVRGPAQAFYRIHQDSMLRTNWAEFLPDFEQRRAVFDAFFDDYGPRVRDAARLHDLARRALARDALWAACRAIDRGRTGIPVEGLVAFASDTYPAYRSLREYRSLQRRQRLGAELCGRTRLFVASSAGRRVRHWAWRQGWKWRGV